MSSTGRTAAQAIATWCASLTPETLPPLILHAAKRCLLDAVGVALAGADMPWVERVLAVARAQEAPPRATVLGHPDRTSPALAALVNGTAVHALDYDDDPAACHIGAVVVPVALALAERHRLAPARVLTAIVLGYDVTTRIAEGVDSDLLYQKGFHPTSACGVFGAAAAAAWLRGLDAEGIAHALGIAGSSAAGNLEFLADGAMTKRLQPGKAAHDGLLAAELAGAGFTGPRTILEGRYGFWRYTERLDAARFTRDLGTRFAVREVFVKKHACCLANAPVIDGVETILREAGLGHEAIAEVRLGMRVSSVAMVDEPRELRVRPQTMLDAQMSLPYSLAVALIDGEAGVAQFEPARLRDPRVLQLAERIHGYAHPDLAGAKAGNLTTYIDLTTTDGRTLHRRFEHYRGHPANPLSDDEMQAKFERCAGRRLSPARVQDAARAIWTLETHESLAPLLTAVGGRDDKEPPA